jgi:competence protein ComEA
MPTPGERRALIFLASVAALGVAVRGWREFHPRDSAELAGNRTALARQIEAVDSAIAVSSSKRKPRAPRAPDTAKAEPARVAPVARASKARVRQPAPVDTLPRDPRQAYWDRSLYFDSVHLALDARDHPAARQNLRDIKAPLQSGRERGSTRAGPPIDLDLAGMDELAALPMIGPALARRIVSDRVENGPFGSIAELERIHGITHAFAHRLEPFVTFSRSPRHGSTGERRPQSKSERRPGGKSRP